MYIDWENYGNGKTPMAVIEHQTHKFNYEQKTRFIELVVSINGDYYHVNIRQYAGETLNRVKSLIITKGENLEALMVMNNSFEPTSIEVSGLVSWILDTFN